MSADTHSDTASLDGDGMGEYPIVCLEPDEAAHIPPQLPPSFLGAHDCTVLKSKGVYVKEFCWLHGGTAVSDK